LKERLTFNVQALKAPNMTAQGNALGYEHKRIVSPERAKQYRDSSLNGRGYFVAPFQG
jgi:hypothetical protein